MSLKKLKTAFWYAEVLKISGLTSAYQLDMHFDAGNSKLWNKYKNVTRVPSRKTLAEVELQFPGTQRAFKLGPNRFFEILESESLREAIAIILLEIETILNSHGFQLTETPFVPENISLADYLHEVSDTLVKNSAFYGVGKCFAPLKLAIFHSASRFLDYRRPLISTVDSLLLDIEDVYRVSPQVWSYDNEISEAQERVVAFKKFRTLVSVDES